MIALASHLPDWNALHFLRPEWLWALLALPVILAVALYRQRRSDAWRQAVDAHLLPHLLAAGARRRVRLPLAVLLGWTLAALAMAGPSWRQQVQPMFQPSAPLLIVLDLSSRITATDLPPSRLLQARAKVGELLRARKGGQVGLVVYAEDAYTVAPLTDDGSNVALYLDALSPDVMPRDGQRADRGIDWATRLMRQIAAAQGQILLVTDQADGEAALAAAQARGLGLQVSVLGLGTPAGAAYRDDSGQIRQAALDEGRLRAVATAGGGRYARITADGSDLRALGVLDAREGTAAQRPGEGRQWRDEGFWLLPPVMLLALLAFRRRALLAAVLAVGLLPWMGMCRRRQLQRPLRRHRRARCGSGPTSCSTSAWLTACRPIARATSPLRASSSRASTVMRAGTTWPTRWRARAATTKPSPPTTARWRCIPAWPMRWPTARWSMPRASAGSRGQGQDQQKPQQNGQQKQQNNSQGQRNPQGQQPQQGQKDRGRANRSRASRASPGRVTTTRSRRLSPASAAAMDSRRHHRWRMPRRRPRLISSSASACSRRCSRRCSRHVRARANRMANPCQAVTALLRANARSNRRWRRGCGACRMIRRIAAGQVPAGK